MFLAFLGAIFLFGGAVITSVVRQSDTELRLYGKFLIVAGLVFVALPLFWGCASSRTGRALNVGVIASGIADNVSTEYALHQGAIEMNPIMQGGPLQRAVLKGVGIGTVIGLTHLIEQKHPVLAHVLRGVVITGWSLVSLHNVQGTR